MKRTAKQFALCIESGEDYLFDDGQFVFVEFPQAVRRKIARRATSQLTSRCCRQTQTISDGARSALASDDSVCSKT